LAHFKFCCFDFRISFWTKPQSCVAVSIKV